MKDISSNFHISRYCEAAQKLGIDFELPYNGNLALFRKDKKSWIIICAMTPLNGSPNTRIAKNKVLSKKLLKKANLNTPNSETFTEIEDGLQFFQSHINEKFVIKPNKGMAGNGITLLPTNETEFKKAFVVAKEVYKKVLVEEFINGNNYRLLVLGDKVIAGSLRLPAYILGNGKNTIGELIEQENVNRKSSSLHSMKIDNEVEETLRSNKLTLESVPEKNRRVYIRRNSNLSTGGTTEDVTDIIDPQFSDIAVRAAKTIGLKLAGVDIITEDISKFSENYVINELNAHPGLDVHYLPSIGKPREVAVTIQKYILEHIEQ